MLELHIRRQPITLGSITLVFADLFNHANLALITLMTESAEWFAAIH